MHKTNHGRVNMTDVAVNEGTDSLAYTTANGTAINEAYTNALADECFTKSAEHADVVIKDLKAEYKKELDKDLSATEEEKTQEYPLILQQKSYGSTTNDYVYQSIFGVGNSTESILELQYDGTTMTNGTFSTYLSYLKDNVFTPAYMTASNVMYAGASSSNPTTGYGKTDLRLLGSLNYFSTESRKPITKFITKSVSVPNTENVTDLGNLSASTAESSIYNFRTTRSESWPVYRLSDVMLIKAEAIARMSSPSEEQIDEGYFMTNQIFKRNNPALVGYDDAKASSCTGDREYLLSYRVDDKSTDKNSNYVKTYKPTFSAAGLLTLVYQERQREFFGEGKRWFDIVRQVEASNDPKGTLTDFITLKNSVKSRLTQLYAFYNPVYSEEIKVNGPETGGNLVQNPVWDRYTKK